MLKEFDNVKLYVTWDKLDAHVILSTKPADWDTNWTAYYSKSGSTYSRLTGAKPEFVADTYYKLTVPVIQNNENIASVYAKVDVYSDHINVLDDQIANKPNASALSQVAFDGRYSSLTEQLPIESSIGDINKTSTNPPQTAAVYDYVNSSIETATATFRGTFTSLTLMNQVQNADKNDYAFLKLVQTWTLLTTQPDDWTDNYSSYYTKNNDDEYIPVTGSVAPTFQTDTYYRADGNITIKRYKYDDENHTWVYEFDVNTTSYTSAQWAAINSGITAYDNTRYSDHVSSTINNATTETETLSFGDSLAAITSVTRDAYGHLLTYVTTTFTLPSFTQSQQDALDSGITSSLVTKVSTDVDTAGTGLSKDGTTLNHSNSITANTTQSFGKTSHDAQGHITGFTPATTAQNNAINSGVTSNDVSQISYLRQLLDGFTVSRLIDFENDTTDVLVGDLSRLKCYSNMNRCVLADDGSVVSWYGDAEYDETGASGQVMVWVPKFYYRVEPLKLVPIGTGGLGGYHLKKAIYSISDYPLAGYKLHPAFENESGNEVDGFYMSAFEASTYDVSASAYNITDAQTVDFTTGTGDLLSSIGCTTAGTLTTGAKPTSGVNQDATRVKFETIAQNRGQGWHSLLIKQASAIQMLMLVEAGIVTHSSPTEKPNTQLNFGSGITTITDNTSYNCASLTGSTVGNITGNAASTVNEINGTKTTYNTDGKVSTNYRGIENFYGNIWKFVWGVNIWGDGNMRGGAPYICNDFNFSESIHTGNYQTPGFTCPNTASVYISAFGYNDENYDWLLMGSDTTGGGANKIIGDWVYVTPNLNDYRISRLGGYWYNSSNAGGFFWYLANGVGYRYRSGGSRLMYIPQS